MQPSPENELIFREAAHEKTVMILRERLFSIIRRLGEEPERYARKPGRDFTRKRTLTPAALIQLIVTMDEKSIWKGLLGHFRRRIDTPSASAFVQQRQKLLPSALEDLFHRFSDHLRPQKKFRGYRLLAADGFERAAAIAERADDPESCVALK